MKNKKDLFSNRCNFIKGVAAIDGLEHSIIPEVAFLGRSNVGKSSLLNAITKRSKLAHTSKTPGRTQELNFFSFGEDRTNVACLLNFETAQNRPPNGAQNQILSPVQSVIADDLRYIGKW